MMMPSDTTKHVVDAASVVTVVGTIMNYLPAIAALFTIIWTAIRIWETDTVQRIFKGAKQCPQDGTQLPP